MSIFGMGDLFKDKKVDEDLFKPKEEKNYIKVEDVGSDSSNYKKFLSELEEIAEKAEFWRIDPGTQGWMIIWKSHPELQSQMLEWMKHKFIWCEDRQQYICALVCKYDYNNDICGKCGKGELIETKI